jgi:hypothetical protein
VSPRGEFNLENHRTFLVMQRAIEAKKYKGKGPLRVVQKAKEKPKEKAHVFVAAPQPNQPKINEPTGDGGEFMGFSSCFSNVGFLPRPSSANPWWSVIGAPNFLQAPPPQRQLPVLPQTHITGPTSANGSPSKFCKSPAKPYDVIYDPLPNDILLGRGKPIQDRPANVRFREMLDKNSEKYAKGGNGGKAMVSTYMVHIVKEEGGRFLKELEDGGWVEVDEATAKAKVSQTFRTRRQVFQATPLKKDKNTT